MRKALAVLGVLVLLAVTTNVGAAPLEAEAWVVPDEGAVEMFRQGDRAFPVGGDAGGAGAVVSVTAELFPSPGSQPIHHSKCAMNVETCSGSCVAYLNYYCKPDSCRSFKFC